MVSSIIQLTTLLYAALKLHHDWPVYHLTVPTGGVNPTSKVPLDENQYSEELPMWLVPLTTQVFIDVLPEWNRNLISVTAISWEKGL